MFPKDFWWGSATAAYQVEGATSEDGRGPSIWDTFSHTPGKTDGGDTGDVACDQYHRYEEDAKLMADLGVKHYRFSISWPRILPEGRGAVNEKGVDYYRRLVDALRQHGITPHATLFHWDLPKALQDRYAGWQSREVAKDFGDYATAKALISPATTENPRPNSPALAASMEPFTASMLVRKVTFTIWLTNLVDIVKSSASIFTFDADWMEASKPFRR